jgi:hypothetical protein
MNLTTLLMLLPVVYLSMGLLVGYINILIQKSHDGFALLSVTVFWPVTVYYYIRVFVFDI